VTDVVYLDLEDLLALTRRLAVGPVRDVGLLDAACARPRATAFGVHAYPDLHHKAAALLHSIANNHPLVDGNKRLAWLATVVFLDLNGVEVTVSDDDAFDLVIRVAEGRADLGEIATALAEGRT
jgi:death on curing protein